MGVALVMTTSRGGIISLVAEVAFLAIVTAIWRTQNQKRGRTKSNPLKSVAVRAGLAGALLVGLFFGVLLLGGEFSIYRFIHSVNTDDPTPGRRRPFLRSTRA